MPVVGLDHFAIPTANAERLVAFYQKLGFSFPDLEEWRAGHVKVIAVACGDQKFHIHPEGFIASWPGGVSARGDTAVPGCGDFCFVWEGGLEALHEHLERVGAPIVHGPVNRIGGRAGGTTPSVSVYIRDPDFNLVEFMIYDA
jgi:catechol 2,3-dioxygenase-like lactoylglutathione lyase family enzyme